MPMDLPRELAALRHYAEGLQEALAKAQQYAPRRATGIDRTGAVTARAAARWNAGRAACR